MEKTLAHLLARCPFKKKELGIIDSWIYLFKMYMLKKKKQRKSDENVCSKPG